MGQMVIKRVAAAIMVCGVLVFSVWAGTKSPSLDNVLDDQPFTDPTHAVVVYQKAPEFSIKVASNPTTGYSWYLADCDPAIQPMNHRDYGSQSGRVGAPGYEVWVFKVSPDVFVVPRVLKVDMVYARPFEISSGRHKVFSVIVGVSNLAS